MVQFNALREANRPALSLVNGEVYAEWASHGDNGPYHGWVVAWNVTNLSTQGMVLSGVLCTDPNGGEGGIWGGGGGLTFDPDETFNGQPAFYFETGNGDPRGGPPPLDANGFPADDDYYESLVKVEADPTTTATNQNSNGWGMKIVDYFTPYNVNALDDADEDFGSGSPLVLPDSAGIPGHPHLIVAAGKEGTIYLLDRDNLGKFNVNDDNVLNSVYNPSTGITTPPVLINGSLSTPAYYHGTLYWVAGYNSNAWSYVVAPNPAPDPPTVPVATLEPTSETANNNFGYLPGSVMISADGSEDPAGGIAWIMDTNNDELHAYSTLSLSTELWNSGPGSIAGGQVRGANRGQRPGFRRHAEQPASLRAHRSEYAGPGAQRSGQRQRPGAIGFGRRTELDRQYGIAELRHQLRHSGIHGWRRISRRWPMPARSRRATPSPA